MPIRSLLAGLGLLLSPPPPALAQRALLIQTDFGLAEGSIAEMKGVAFAVDRGLRIFDLTHLIPPYDVWEAAVRLQQTAPYWPSGTVFVSIVDPGVGTDRRAVVVRSRSGHFFVGPDNGLFSLILADHPEAEVRQLTNAALFRANVSSTFHGRDIFGPVGGALARGTAFAEVGPTIEDAFRFEFPMPKSLDDGGIEGQVIYIDTYGNLVSTIGGSQWQTFVHGANGDLTEMVAEVGRVVVPVVTTFGDVPDDEACAYLGSTGRIEVAVNQGSAAKRFEASIGTPVKLKRLSS